MSIFTPAERAYLQSQLLGRLATVGSDGQPHVVPVAFRYNPDLDTIDVGGHGFATRKKFRDVRRNPLVAFVVDDIGAFAAMAFANPAQYISKALELAGDELTMSQVAETYARVAGMKLGKKSL